MVAPVWADVSSWQPLVNDAYPYDILAIRSNDGNFTDPHFMGNYNWAINALNSGKLKCLIVYFVYRQNWQETVNTHISLLGNAHPRVISMIDVESWNGQITGDQSVSINNVAAVLNGYYTGNARRIIGYGNKFDLEDLWPHYPSTMQYIVADYNSIGPSYPGCIGWQFSSSFTIPPFGSCDANRAISANTSQDFCRQVGIDSDIPGDNVNPIMMYFFNDAFVPDPTGMNFRGVMPVEAGNNSAVISVGWVRWGVRWGNATFKIVAWNGNTPLGEPNYSLDYFQIPPGTRSVTVEGRRDGPAALPNAAFLAKPY